MPDQFGITYDSFDYVTTQSSIIYTGVETVSKPNAAMLFLPALGNLTAPTGKCLKLKSFAYGCTTTNVQPLVNVPIMGNVALNAVNNAGQSIGSQSLTFKPNDIILSKMNAATVNLPAAKTISISVNILKSTDPAVQGLLKSIPLLGGLMAKTYERIIDGLGPRASAGLFDDFVYEIVDGSQC